MRMIFVTSVIYRSLFLILLALLAVSFSLNGQTTCYTHVDATKDLDRKDFGGPYSEGYHLNFDMPSDPGAPCMKITEVSIEVTISLVDYSGVVAPCAIGQTYLNIYADDVLPFGAGTVPTNRILDEPNQANPFNLNGTYTFACNDGGNNIFFDFDSQVGVDLVPVSNTGCSGGQSHVSDNLAILEFDICVTVTVDLIGSAGIDANATETTLCLGEDIELTESDGNNVDWSWDGPNGFTSIDNNPVITNITAAEIGTYSVTVTDGDGCTDEQTVDIMMHPTPIADATAADTDVCPGQTIELDEISGDGIMWNWDGPNGFSSTVQDPTIPNSTSSDVGTYNVTITDGNGCMSTSSITVDPTASPNAMATAADLTVCENQDILLDEIAGDATSWNWTGPNGFTSTDKDPTISSSSSSDIGTYTVAITNADGCTNTSDVTISTGPPPIADPQSLDDEICPGQDIELDEIGGDAVSWSWSGPNGFSSTSQDPVISNSTTNDLGTYTVTVTDANGCTSSFDEIIISGPIPAANATADNLQVCPGQDIVLDEDGIDSDSWMWSGPDGFTSTLPSPTISNITSANLGTYTVTVTDVDGCTNTSDVTITAGTPPSATAAAASLMVCPGDDIMLDETAGAGTQWDWTGPNGFTSSMHMPTITNSTPADLGTYSVIVTDNTGCTNSSSVTITAAACACSLDDAMLTATSCNENTTPSDDTDDYIIFSLNPQGTNLGSGYTLSVIGGTVTPATGTYGSTAGFQLQNGSAGSGNVVLTITDDTDPNCTITVTIMDPGTCSGSCSITSANLGTPVCTNNSTPNDDTDDIIEFTLNPLGANLGANYTVSVSGGSITPIIGNYNTMETFQLQSGSAGLGNVFVTLTDATDPNCTIQVTIIDPGVCSVPFDCPILMLNIGDACDDNNPATANDIVLADCSCSGEYDCPILMMNIGDPCDDGDPVTMSDEINANCVCEGFTSFDCPVEMVNFGDSCDDGNPDTANDVIQLDCTCAGEYDCPILMMNIGDSCDDGDPATMADEINANCVCEGLTSFDCPVEMVNFGDSCDDGNPDTANDVIQSDCTCAGEYDCPIIMMNIGDPCDDGDPATMADEINANCVCEGFTSFDCPVLMVNFGDACDDGNLDTDNDVIQPDCTCAGEYDCPTLMMNIGDPCDDGDPATMADEINANCDCEGFTSFDCPVLMVNFGDACDDGNPDTENDVILPDCTCAGEYDCPTLMMNIGDPCDDGDPATMGDEINANCDCEGFTSFDCPVLMANFGDACDDGNPDTANDIIQPDCTCAGEYDCPSLMLNIGDPCDDGDPATMSDTVNADCDCEGSLTFDCPALMANIGDPCDDDDPNSINDFVQPDCTCLGEYDCPTILLNIGDPCDDLNPTTENDTVDSNCDCVGTSIFDCPLLMLNIGDACDDQDSDTTDDIVTATCECRGMPSDCMTAVPIVEECNDDIDCTINDTQTVLPNGTICEPCLGERITCETGPTLERPCDDLDPTTVNDLEVILVCDESICEPCAGVFKETDFYIPNAFSLNDTENREFGIYSDEPIQIMSLGIYDRWGQFVFSVSNILSSDPSAKWDGRKNNVDVNQGVYVYRLEFVQNGQSRIEIGQITLVR